MGGIAFWMHLSVFGVLFGCYQADKMPDYWLGCSILVYLGAWVVHLSALIDDL